MNRTETADSIGIKSTSMRVVLLLMLFTALVLPFFVFSPAAAVTTYNQPTTFTIGDASGAMDAYAYQSVLEEGDEFFLARFFIYYAVPANAPNSVGEAYLGSAQYNGTNIGSVEPYAFFDTGGEAEWFFAVYLTAAQVDAWDTAFGAPMWNTTSGFSMQIVGNPTLTWAGGAPPAAQMVRKLGL